MLRKKFDELGMMKIFAPDLDKPSNLFGHELFIKSDCNSGKQKEDDETNKINESKYEH